MFLSSLFRLVTQSWGRKIRDEPKKSLRCSLIFGEIKEINILS